MIVVVCVEKGDDRKKDQTPIVRSTLRVAGGDWGLPPFSVLNICVTVPSWTAPLEAAESANTSTKRKRADVVVSRSLACASCKYVISKGVVEFARIPEPARILANPTTVHSQDLLGQSTRLHAGLLDRSLVKNPGKSFSIRFPNRFWLASPLRASGSCQFV